MAWEMIGYKGRACDKSTLSIFGVTETEEVKLILNNGLTNKVAYFFEQGYD